MRIAVEREKELLKTGRMAALVVGEGSGHPFNQINYPDDRSAEQKQ